MFKVAGVSVREGQMRVRWANDMTRVKVLHKTGNTDINMIELPEPMEKGPAVAYLKTTDMYNDARAREAIDAADAKYNGTGETATKQPRVKAEKKTKAEKPARQPKVKIKAEPAVKSRGTRVAPSLEAIRARAAGAAEDSSKKPQTEEAA